MRQIPQSRVYEIDAPECVRTRMSFYYKPRCDLYLNKAQTDSNVSMPLEKLACLSIVYSISKCQNSFRTLTTFQTKYLPDSKNITDKNPVGQTPFRAKFLPQLIFFGHNTFGQYSFRTKNPPDSLISFKTLPSRVVIGFRIYSRG